MVREMEDKGLIRRQGEQFLARIGQRRQANLARLADARITRSMTAAFSAEMAGTDHRNLPNADNLQNQNRAVACSPSATLILRFSFALETKSAGVFILRSDTQWQLFECCPLDVFEVAWTPWNLSLLPSLINQMPHTGSLGAFLASAWQPGRLPANVGFGASLLKA